MENTDLKIMSVEADIYDSLNYISENFKIISDNIHLLNFTSTEDVHVNFRASLHNLLTSSIRVQQTLLELLEKVYKYHQVDYS